jgi:enoyl-CoA hydratase/carnithine racemase
MQQAYRALRIVSEAQTIRMVLATHPGELMLKELRTACATLDTGSSNGVKAVVLDFAASQDVPRKADETLTQTIIDQACVAVRAVPQPVLAVVRDTLSVAACALVFAADLTLVASDALMIVPANAESREGIGNLSEANGVRMHAGGKDGLTPLNSSAVPVSEATDTLTGAQAARLGYVTWSVPTQQINREMERILDMLRGKSALALRLTKESMRLGQADHTSRLEALSQVNSFYLTQVMQSTDAHEGLKAFLEKRQPEWKNA